MSFNARSSLFKALVLGGCVLFLGGCSYFRRPVSPTQNFPWETEMGAAEVLTEHADPDAEPLAHYLAAQLDINDGDYDGATHEYELAVAGDPQSAMLRRELAKLYIRANR